MKKWLGVGVVSCLFNQNVSSVRMWKLWQMSHSLDQQFWHRHRVVGYWDSSQPFCCQQWMTWQLLCKVWKFILGRGTKNTETLKYINELETRCYFVLTLRKKMFYLLDLNLFSFCQMYICIILELPVTPFLSNLCFIAIRARFTTL